MASFPSSKTPEMRKISFPSSLESSLVCLVLFFRMLSKCRALMLKQVSLLMALSLGWD
jgi:hypothetical protein